MHRIINLFLLILLNYMNYQSKNTKKNVDILKFILQYSGTPLIRSPTGRNNMAVLMGWPC